MERSDFAHGYFPGLLVGINLQCAQVVILMEPQFKPSTERQAIARVRRMGQTRKVNAHRLIAQGGANTGSGRTF